MSAQPVPAAAKRKRRVGVLGCGALGEYLIRFLARNDALELSFAWNRTDARLDALVADLRARP